MFVHIAHFVSAHAKELVTMAASMTPMYELKNALPMAVSVGIPFKKAFVLTAVGNMAPVIPMLYFLEPLSVSMERNILWAEFLNIIKVRTATGQKIVSFCLMLFVACPLPATGIWLGCVIASIFKVRFRYAFIAIALGVIVGGIVIAMLIHTGRIIT